MAWRPTLTLGAAKGQDATVFSCVTNLGKELHETYNHHTSPPSQCAFVRERESEEMSLSIDLTTHGRDLQGVYDRIISGSALTSWAVFSYDKGASNELKVQAQGSTNQHC